MKKHKSFGPVNTGRMFDRCDQNFFSIRIQEKNNSHRTYSCNTCFGKGPGLKENFPERLQSPASPKRDSLQQSVLSDKEFRLIISFEKLLEPRREDSGVRALSFIMVLHFSSQAFRFSWRNAWSFLHSFIFSTLRIIIISSNQKFGFFT